MKNFSDVFYDNNKKIIVGLTMVLVALVATAPAVLSAEVSVPAKVDLLPVAEVPQVITNEGCKVDLLAEIMKKEGCQSGANQTVVYQSAS